MAPSTIIRIPEDFGLAFPNPELAEEIIRVSLPPVPDAIDPLTLPVRPQDLDPMGHVNNAVYLDWVEEAIGAAGGSATLVALPRRVAIEYAASAEPGDTVEASAWPTDDGWAVRLVRAADGIDVLRARIRA